MQAPINAAKMQIPAQAPPFFFPDHFFMGLILLEALGALALLVLIVWWTMFSGRKGGEPNPPKDDNNAR